MLFAIMYDELNTEQFITTYYSYKEYFNNTFYEPENLILEWVIDTEKPPKGKTYKDKQSTLQNQAIAYQHAAGSNESILSYWELSSIQGYFSRYGKRYGLLKEFKENGII